MSTTASETRKTIYLGLGSNRVSRFSGRFEHYHMHRFGTKDYGFIHAESGVLARRYKCSHIEARRRFKLWWITRRLLS